MKKPFALFVSLLVLGVLCARLLQRYREESLDKNAMVLVEWSDAVPLAARTGLSDAELLTLFKQHGATAVLVSESSVQDYLARGMLFASYSDAKEVQDQCLMRGLSGVRVESRGRTPRLSRASSWEPVKEMSLGFDPGILRQVQEAGLRSVLRMNHDPWITSTSLFQELESALSDKTGAGVLFNSDTIPSGQSSQIFWTRFLRDHALLHLLPEFKPSKSARSMAARLPEATFRTHSIAPNEFKDLTPLQERARWTRALRERSCRFLLVRASLEDSLESYLARVRNVRAVVEENAFQALWPAVRPSWQQPGQTARRLAPLIALLLAVLTPALALHCGLGKKSWTSFAVIALVTLAGASAVAAIADNPLTRLQVIPFRGVKATFLLGWAGCFAVLYTKEEWKSLLAQPLKRWDALCLFLAAGVIGYFLIRTGNAGGSWKMGWEQGLRNFLEQLLIARPRFKEFAVGYPLLILGLHTQRHAWSRVLIGLGMIGPISMINTFCHLHSPLALAYLRSANGLLLGCLFGILLLQLRKWLPRS